MIAMRPNISAIVIHENGDIAYHADRPVRTCQPQGPPLLPEKKLDDASHRDFLVELSPSSLQCRRITPRQLGWPLVPAALHISVPQRVVEYVVFQPPVIFRAE